MTKNLSMGISVVLPNYNGKKLLSQNLPYLYKALSYTELDHEIIVSDDCSSDGSIDFLYKNYPDIIITKTKINSGFSINSNNGIKKATKSFLCVANTDVQFTPEYFTTALRHFTDPNIFSIKGDICNYSDNREKLINVEKETRLYFRRGFLRFNYDFSKEIQYDIQFSLLGSCFLCRTSIMREFDGFNEIFSPFYWEDSDLALRAMYSGYQVKYVSDCPVYHKISSTISSEHTMKWRKLISYRNKFLFTWLHLRSIKRWGSHVILVIFSLLLRWLILDWKYYSSLFMALYRIRTFKKGKLNV